MFGVLGGGLSSTFADPFTRADSATIAASGFEWAEVGPWSIAGNTVRREGDPGASALDIAYRPTVIADGFAECVPLNYLIGPAIRWDTTLGLGVGYTVYHNLANVRLVRVNQVAPTLTELGTSSLLPDLATDTLAIEAIGDVIRVYLNGSEIIDATDAVWTTGLRGIVTIDDLNAVSADNYAEGT